MDYIIQLVDDLLNEYETRNPFEIANILNIEIIHYQFFNSNIKGIIIFDRKFKKHIIGLNINLNPMMQKLVLSHELGHAFLHPDTSRYFIEKNTLFNKDTFEYEANIFAAELLIETSRIKYLLEERKSVKHISYELNLPQELVMLKIENIGKSSFFFTFN